MVLSSELEMIFSFNSLAMVEDHWVKVRKCFFNTEWFKTLTNEIIEKISKDYNEYTIFAFQEKNHDSNDILKENGFNERLEIVILERKI